MHFVRLAKAGKTRYTVSGRKKNAAELIAAYERERGSMWTVCITSISHVLKLNGYGRPQAKVNEKSQGFKGWETLGLKLIKNAWNYL